MNVGVATGKSGAKQRSMADAIKQSVETIEADAVFEPKVCSPAFWSTLFHAFFIDTTYLGYILLQSSFWSEFWRCSADA